MSCQLCPFPVDAPLHYNGNLEASGGVSKSSLICKIFYMLIYCTYWNTSNSQVNCYKKNVFYAPYPWYRKRRSTRGNATSCSFLVCHLSHKFSGLNPRPAGVFGRTCPAGEADFEPPPPCVSQERVIVARWARRQTKVLDEYFLSKF